MREILFRGKLKCNGDWSYGNLIVKPNVISLITPDDTPLGRYGEIDPETVGQYTGLTDRNGTKIFEGDIMQLTSGTYPCLVYWDGRGFKWLSNGKRRDIDLTYEKMAIIGNIYDNPELIEVVGNIYDTRGNKFN